ncbi:branched-chain amino acid ABC transporter permease [uncultured Arcobacter sp.]|uniref:branched-chain amino acid ABC transporter permease n=1 Tax=uncultured Arcobacter sp. TaxID=165434 RepID=UPI00260F9E83|nr:branched-chain amino acid ABC transporter permease [uncultured Arcobacter sp.]
MNKNFVIYLLVSILIIVFTPYIFDDYGMRIINNIFIFIILAASYNLINGVTGQFSLEPNGFAAIGAYVTALCLLSEDLKWELFQLEDPAPWVLALNTSLVPALLLSGLAATFVAICLAIPVFRVRGDYLAIVTLGFGFIIKVIAINSPEITNGSIGLNEIPSVINIYWTGGIAILTVIIMLNIIYSKYGRAMKAVRDDEDAASAIGINTFKIKTMAFGTSAFFEGIGGGLLAVLLTTISPDLFTFFLTFQLLIIIVLGGLGSMSGAILGTILVIGGSEWLRFLDDSLNIFGYQTDAHPGLRMVVFSLILIIVMLFAREGIMGRKEFSDIFKRRRK